MSNIPVGYELDDNSTSQREREDKILREKFPMLSSKSFVDPTARAYFLGKAETDLPTSGAIVYRRYKNPDTGAILHLPEGDSGAWLPKAKGFRGRFTEIKHVNGLPRIASSLKKTVTYD